MPRDQVRGADMGATTIHLPCGTGRHLVRWMKSHLRPIDVVNEFEDAETLIHPHERNVGFQVLVKRFDATVKTIDVVEWFQERSYDGSMAALFTWVLRARPIGSFASIPSEEQYLWKRPTIPLQSEADPKREKKDKHPGELFVPCFRSNGKHHELYLESVNGFWSPSWTFVGFKALAS